MLVPPERVRFELLWIFDFAQSFAKWKAEKKHCLELDSRTSNAISIWLWNQAKLSRSSPPSSLDRFVKIRVWFHIQNECILFGSSANLQYCYIFAKHLNASGFSFKLTSDTPTTSHHCHLKLTESRTINHQFHRQIFVCAFWINHINITFINYSQFDSNSPIFVGFGAWNQLYF